jgi:phosphatidylserine/phosphatidylglycerophosphate/cardiolipin synthase-like enzyme
MNDDPTILFSPEDRIVDHIMDGFLSANETIDIVVYLIGSKTVANTLVKAHKKGVAIRIIIDGKVGRTRYSKHKFLVEKGIDVRTIRVRSGSMHSKFVLIDGIKLIAGSANLTNDANYRNHEFMFVSEETRIIQQFAEKFEELWAVGSPC